MSQQTTIYYVIQSSKGAFPCYHPRILIVFFTLYLPSIHPFPYFLSSSSLSHFLFFQPSPSPPSPTAFDDSLSRNYASRGFTLGLWVVNKITIYMDYLWLVTIGNIFFASHLPPPCNDHDNLQSNNFISHSDKHFICIPSMHLILFLYYCRLTTISIGIPYFYLSDTLLGLFLSLSTCIMLHGVSTEINWMKMKLIISSKQ